jgi:hypothetical protein
MRISVALLYLLAAAPAGAVALDASLTTLIAGRQDPRDGRVYSAVPAYQSISLTLSDVKLKFVDDVRLVLSAWGQATFIDPQAGLAADLDLFYLEGKLFKQRLHIRLGRQLLYGGAFRSLPVDGAMVNVRVVQGLHIMAAGGAPVTPLFGTSRGDALGGVRLSYRIAWNGEVGLSFVQVSEKGRTLRQEAAADLQLQPHRMVWLTGFAALSTVDARVSEADVALRVTPHRIVEASVDWRRLAPDLFIPRSSIFSVFSQETRDEAGASVYLRPHARVRLYLHSHLISAEAGLGHRTAGKFTLSLGPQGQATVGVEARIYGLPDERGFEQLRLFATYRVLTRLFFTVDCDGYHLDRPVNGQTFSFTGAGTIGVDIGRGVRTLITLIGDTTPQVQSRFEGLFKLAVNETVFFHERRP